jgi:hypothetical protein
LEVDDKVAFEVQPKPSPRLPIALVTTGPLKGPARSCI